MYSEISATLKHVLFNQYDFKLTDNEEKETYRKQWYYCNQLQTTVVVLMNFNSCITQYYIQDINA